MRDQPAAIRLRSTSLPALLAVALLSLTACAAPAAEPSTPAPQLSLSSGDLDSDGYLPEWGVGQASGFCSGENRSPSLEWANVPDGTEGFIITMTDPAHPSYVHWVVTGLDGELTSLEAADGGQPSTGVVGTSGAGAGLYVGPCLVDNPYLYTLYALDELVTGDSGTTLIDVTGLIDGHVLATAELEAKRH